MKTQLKDEKYLEKAKLLSREEVERLFSRMQKKLTRRLEDNRIIPLEAIARQLELEDEQLNEWREKLAEIRKKHQGEQK